MTKVINIKSGKKYDVYCGRSGKGQDGYFGNPHVIGYCKICDKIHNRKDSIESFKDYFFTKLDQDTHFRVKVKQLKDKVLGCFCKPLSCHCDVIVEYLENQEKHDENVVCVGPIPNRVIIAGSRDIEDYNLLRQCIKESNFKIDEIVCGCAKGVDSLGEQWAKENNVPIKRFPADWKEFGKAAGPIRNKKMAEYATHLILIHHNSSGSLNMKKVAHNNNLVVYEKVVNKTK